MIAHTVINIRMAILMKFYINNDVVDIGWTDENNLLDSVFKQRPPCINNETHDAHYNLQAVYQHSLDRMARSGIFDNLKSGSRILDIGSGVGVLGSILSKYLDSPSIWLLDRNFNSTNIIQYDPSNERKSTVEYRSKNNNHGFYNSWSPMLDSIKTNNLNKDSIHFLEPDDELPDNLDLVISTYSWCWHYPKSVYWQRVKKVLKPKAGLFLTVSNWEEFDFIKEISEELNCQPNQFSEPMPKNHYDPSQWMVDKAGNRGYTCFWRNNSIL